MENVTKKKIQVCINPHYDGVALWIGSWGGADSPCDISRGVHAAKRGVPRLIDLFKRNGIADKITWGVTGHAMESFPKATQMIIDTGAEIGVHGYLHENPMAMTKEQEAAVLDKTIGIIEKLSGKKPVGYMAPWWELSKHTVALLQERGFLYDSSLMEDDFHPHYLRVGDSWTKVDYTKKAEEWMHPWKAGEKTEMVEIPCSWHLDDAPPMLFVKASANSHGWITGSQLYEIWMDQFDWVYRHFDYAVFPMCIHPDASGHPHVLVALEKMIDHIRKHEGVEFCTFKTMAETFKEMCPFGSGKDELIGGVQGI